MAEQVSGSGQIMVAPVNDTTRSRGGRSARPQQQCLWTERHPEGRQWLRALAESRPHLTGLVSEHTGCTRLPGQGLGRGPDPASMCKIPPQGIPLVPTGSLTWENLSDI